MYSRQRDDQTYTFEASGGLLNAGLVMRDRETDSWWSIINEEAIHGPAEGQRLEQVPGSVKTTWGDWRRRHPHSRVLSVEGQEHRAESPYDRYFASEEGFRKLKASDGELRDKAAIYVFHYGGKPFAVPHSEFAGGGVVRLGERQLFLYRRGDDSFYRSTVALLADAGAGFSAAEDGWRLAGGGAEHSFRAAERAFEDEESLAETFTGFDTFWYIWSLTNPETEVLRVSP